MRLSLSAVRIPLKNLKIGVRQELAGKDMSGSSASTDQAETGDKAKVLTVSGTVPYSQPDMLHRIYTLAGAKTKGARQIYRIENPTARALKIAQVKFQGTVSAQEDGGLRQWQVSFELIEYLSVAERTESREPAKPATQQRSVGVATPTASPAPTPTAEVPPASEVEMTGIMYYLQKLDRALS